MSAHWAGRTLSSTLIKAVDRGFVVKKIAFVDDDQRILDGLRRMLRGHRKEWQMAFFESGSELLTAFQGEPFDIVVSDMSMPGMNGAELLSEIKKIKPDTLRIVLSGYADSELIIESLHAAHQFISKPADQSIIEKTIERGVRLQAALDDSEVKARLGEIESLPALPEIYDELMREIASENSSLEQVGKIVEGDMALSSAILKLVNSAFFALVRHIETPSQAAAILGADTIKNLALSNSVFMSFKGSKEEMSQLRKLNTQGQKIGLLASQFARHCGLDGRGKDHVQMAGMLINIGGLVELILKQEVADSEAPMPDSDLLGAYLLGIWAMPFPIVEAVRWHRQPSQSNIDVLSPMAIVHAAWAMEEIFRQDQQVNLESEVLDIAYLDSILGRQMVEELQAIAESYLGDTAQGDENTDRVASVNG